MSMYDFGDKVFTVSGENHIAEAVFVKADNSTCSYVVIKDTVECSSVENSTIFKTLAEANSLAKGRIDAEYTCKVTKLASIKGRIEAGEITPV